MPLLATPNAHFNEDIGRARALVAHAHGQPEGILQDDLYRSAWMMAVGAVDAFFCDAYADLAARTLQAKQIQSDVALSDRMLNLKVPAIAVIRTSSTDNWRWRMAARQIIEDETVLSLDKIKKLLNQFFRSNHKPFDKSNFDSWITSTDAKQRLFGISARDYRQLTGTAKSTQRARSITQFETRYETIFQRRHDCIHNCDRPKVRLNKNKLTETALSKVVYDLSFLVSRFSIVCLEEFPQWLESLGADGVTRGRVLQ